MRLVLVIATVLLPSVGLALSPLSERERATLQSGLIVTADAFILPSYVAQAKATRNMTDALAAYCAGRGGISPVHQGFANSFLAWQRASVVQIGPISNAEGLMRVQLWPDPKGFSQRAVRAAVRERDPAVVQPGALVGRSIALTNFTALEYLLYSELPQNAYSCDLAYAISRFHAELASDMVDAWTPGSAFRAEFDGAVHGVGRYASVDDLLRAFLSGAVVYTDRLRNFKLLRGLGTQPGDARATRTEARLSRLGRESIEVSFRTLAELYDTPFGVFDAAPDVGGSMEYFVLSETAASVADGLAIMDETLEEIAASDGAKAEDLRRVANLVLFHEVFLKTGYLQALGLSAGFTAADGD
ncbi:MAG: imelysin family protein [Pseudomonadota bacterium]